MGFFHFLQSSWTEAGRVGLTFVSLVINLVLGTLTAFVLLRSKTTDILRDEKTAWKDRADRLDGEIKGCRSEMAAKDVELAELRTKTDLKPVLERLELMISSFQQFEVKNSEVHAAMIASLQANTAAIQQTAATLKDHFNEDQKVFGEVKELIQGIREK